MMLKQRKRLQGNILKAGHINKEWTVAHNNTLKIARELLHIQYTNVTC